jgi:FkbM family methyltransferase
VNNPQKTEIDAETEILAAMIKALPALRAHHARTSDTHALLTAVARNSVTRLFSSPQGEPRSFGPFGEYRFPYTRMGAIDSLDLFGLDELIIFAFYWVNKARYKRVADLGTNIGLHTITMARCGYDVRCYEPDPETFALLQANLERNAITGVDARKAAVSVEDGTAEFVRLHGNRTGSHLAGAKSNPYGDLERFAVTVEAFGPIAAWADLMKIDVEGHEAALILATDADTWQATDAMMEIGTPENATAVFDHLRAMGVNMFAQKTGWSAVTERADMPESYRDGSLFVTVKPTMPWD